MQPRHVKVDYVGDGAQGGTGGQIYENKKAHGFSDNDMMGNMALRSAPESCRVVYTPL